MAAVTLKYKEISENCIPDDICIICREPLNECQPVFGHNTDSREDRIHCICKRCLPGWLEVDSTCPICRRNVVMIPSYPPKLIEAGVTSADWDALQDEVKIQISDHLDNFISFVTFPPDITTYILNRWYEANGMTRAGISTLQDFAALPAEIFQNFDFIIDKFKEFVTISPEIRAQIFDRMEQYIRLNQVAGLSVNDLAKLPPNIITQILDPAFNFEVVLRSKISFQDFFALPRDIQTKILDHNFEFRHLVKTSADLMHFKELSPEIRTRIWDNRELFVQFLNMKFLTLQDFAETPLDIQVLFLNDPMVFFNLHYAGITIQVFAGLPFEIRTQIWNHSDQFYALHRTGITLDAFAALNAETRNQILDHAYEFKCLIEHGMTLQRFTELPSEVKAQTLQNGLRLLHPGDRPKFLK
jgi:hypothetical protein